MTDLLWLSKNVIFVLLSPSLHRPTQRVLPDFTNSVPQPQPPAPAYQHYLVSLALLYPLPNPPSPPSTPLLSSSLITCFCTCRQRMNGRVSGRATVFVHRHKARASWWSSLGDGAGEDRPFTDPPFSFSLGRRG